MGEVLAEAVTRVYQESVAGSAMARLIDEEGPQTIDVMDLLRVLSRAVQESLQFLALAIEDPNVMDEALLESMRAYIATEPAG